VRVSRVVVRRRPIIYGVMEWGDPVGQGAYGATFCTLGGVVKADDDPTQTCTAANEYICNRLALALGLPAPPGGLIRMRDQRPAFVSLRFGSLKEAPPPVVPTQFMSDHPDLASGTVAFDCWVANPDRHPGNLAYRRSSIPPAMFDHGLCLAGESRSSIYSMINRVDDPAFENCLTPLLSTAKILEAWVHTIGALPRPTIDGIIAETVGVGLLTADEARLIGGFLRIRQHTLHRLLRMRMLHLPDWGLP
jgi:hypothetical protein